MKHTEVAAIQVSLIVSNQITNLGNVKQNQFDCFKRIIALFVQQSIYFNYNCNYVKSKFTLDAIALHFEISYINTTLLINTTPITILLWALSRTVPLGYSFHVILLRRTVSISNHISKLTFVTSNFLSIDTGYVQLMEQQMILRILIRFENPHFESKLLLLFCEISLPFSIAYKK